MKLNEKRITEEVCKEQVCDECGEPAAYLHTYLLDGSRNNPRSRAYGRDDCSWCSDEDRYACDEHKESVRQNPPEGMRWCSTFPRKKLEHLFLYWKITKQSIAVEVKDENSQILNG